MESEISQRYKSFTIIGRGTHGIVYKAEDKKTGKDVALKKMSFSLSPHGISKNTLREISLLRQLSKVDHPNIVRLLDVSHGNPVDNKMKLYMVFEFIEQDLTAYIKKNPIGFTITHIKHLAKDILYGVDFLHSKRVIHRDLKPQNLLVSHDGRVKLTDFGFSRNYDLKVKLSPMVGTPVYAAPEILLGLSYLTPIDIWSVGCIIVELYRLKPLFHKASTALSQLSNIFGIIGKPSEEDWPEDKTVFTKWSTVDVPPPAKLNEICPNICEMALDLLMKMLAFNPNKRITAMEALSHSFFNEEPLVNS